MGTTLNRSGFEFLIKDNIRWLKDQPQCMERDHIELCLNALPDLIYGKKDNDQKTADAS